jgi:hypothetical protein
MLYTDAGRVNNNVRIWQREILRSLSFCANGKDSQWRGDSRTDATVAGSVQRFA